MSSKVFFEEILGEYQGWIRPIGAEWEDLVGTVRFVEDECEDNNIAIKTMEFGKWGGTIDRKKMIIGQTQEENVYFKLTCRERIAGNQIQIVFDGIIYEEIEKPIYEIIFTKNL